MFLHANHHSIFLCTYLSLPSEVCNSHDKAITGLIYKLECSCLTHHLNGCRVKEVSLLSLRSIMLKYSLTVSHNTRSFVITHFAC
jgi:hypothetical protein